MIRGEAVKVEEASPKVQLALGLLGSTSAYLLENHKGTYRAYAAPGKRSLELIAEGNSLGSFVRHLGAFDEVQKRNIGSYAARLSEGGIMPLDERCRPMV